MASAKLVISSSYTYYSLLQVAKTGQMLPSKRGDTRRYAGGWYPKRMYRNVSGVMCCCRQDFLDVVRLGWGTCRYGLKIQHFKILHFCPNFTTSFIFSYIYRHCRFVDNSPEYNPKVSEIVRVDILDVLKAFEKKTRLVVANIASKMLEKTTNSHNHINSSFMYHPMEPGILHSVDILHTWHIILHI